MHSSYICAMTVASRVYCSVERGHDCIWNLSAFVCCYPPPRPVILRWRMQSTVQSTMSLESLVFFFACERDVAHVLFCHTASCEQAALYDKNAGGLSL